MPYNRSADQQLIQIVDAAFAGAARRSGEWLVCRPGCTQCCIGPFAISELDAERLRHGMKELARTDPARAQRVRERAKESVARLSPSFPGNPETGILDEGTEAEERFAEFSDEEACPALDPETGTCDLYAYRPMTCRTFGPPVRSGPEGGLGVCELCYNGATDEEIARCEMVPDPDDLERNLLLEIKTDSGKHGDTIVAFCVAK
jgi:Fe-S-cluster containining protein